MNSRTDTVFTGRRTVTTGRHRLLIDGTTRISAHLYRHGPLPAASGSEIRAMVADSGLIGRGGAGFPTYRKMEAVAAGRRSVVIANAAEGEPASSKDRTLLAHAPHLVLDGLVLAARAVGAREAHIYLPAAAVDSVRRALTERTDPLPVTVHIAADAFVAGEESAVVSAVAGLLPVPQDKADRIVDRGLRGRPTLVQNVETLAHLALIVRYGSAWFRDQGTPAEPGTFLATISGAVRHPGVYELPYGISLGGLLAPAGGVSSRPQAILLGGYHGAWIPPDPSVEISRAGLQRYGATPGAGIVYVLPHESCGLLTTAAITTYLAEQSAGQCGRDRILVERGGEG